MNTLTAFTLRPSIVVGESDHRKLVSLAMAGLGSAASAFDDLLDELERASVVPETQLPPQVVRMGSRVTFRPEGGPERTVTLVYPKEADISAGRVSVLTPIGTALIGLARGQSITWRARDGKRHALTVLAVEAPHEDGPQAA